MSFISHLLLDLIIGALPSALSAGKKEEYFCVTVS